MKARSGQARPLRPLHPFRSSVSMGRITQTGGASRASGPATGRAVRRLASASGGVMQVDAELERARQAHREQRWMDAVDAFTVVDDVSSLDVEDLERLAEVLDLVGRGDEAIRVMQRAYAARVDAGDIGDALRGAFWLSHALMFNGEFAHAGGWVARAARLIEARPDCAQQGYLLVPEAERKLSDGDYTAAFAIASRAAALGSQCGDRDLVTIATHLQGGALIGQSRIDDGLVLLDEAMLGVSAGETSPRVTGWIYCSTILICHELHEVRRAREWTVALNAWCDALPQFTGAYSGIRRVHRSELLQLTGAWPAAVQEAQLACQQFSGSYGLVVAGAAHYQLAEIHRLRGQFANAEQAYRQASQHGWQNQPGIALLRLAQATSTQQPQPSGVRSPSRPTG
jgi:tetratricopeptide (TPR) repeat protein